jgi:hypothetical protein
MSTINHQNNFATNLTTPTSAGATTSPINSIPSVAAPFYIAFDATNINGHYEVLEISSKTATNVLHSATSYDHTTAEEVRMVVPAVELDNFSKGNIPIQSPQGFLINGKISVTDTGTGLKVEILTLAGTAPSATDPVYCRIGDTVRTISAALSVTKADGTNWMNAGSAELATKEIDYFVYLGYNATDGVVIGFSRIIGNQYSDFSVTTTNEKYAAISTITTAASTDYYEVVGRFAATLSAGAGYTWSVPTFTAINLIQRPIYETRLLTWVPTTTASVGSFTTTTLNYATYRVSGASMYINITVTGTTSGAPQNIRATTPFTVLTYDAFGTGYTTDASAVASAIIITSNIIYSYLATFGNYSAGASRVLRCTATISI